MYKTKHIEHTKLHFQILTFSNNKTFNKSAFYAETDGTINILYNSTIIIVVGHTQLNLVICSLGELPGWSKDPILGHIRNLWKKIRIFA